MRNQTRKDPLEIVTEGLLRAYSKYKRRREAGSGSDGTSQGKNRKVKKGPEDTISSSKSQESPAENQEDGEGESLYS